MNDHLRLVSYRIIGEENVSQIICEGISSQASQKSMFSSLYSQRRNSRNAFRPLWLRISLSKLLPQLRISSSVGLRKRRKDKVFRGVQLSESGQWFDHDRDPWFASVKLLHQQAGVLIL
uniref:Uncharacterized protein n=1 Tax=Anopheles albimanus TaxID=7167 RepID=A0A182FC82_ANOAL